MNDKILMAIKMLELTWDDIRSNGEGYDPSINGGDYIAKITHRSTFVKTDNRSNYCQAECHDCGKSECDDEEWPYSNEFERAGRLELKEMEL